MRTTNALGLSEQPSPSFPTLGHPQVLSLRKPNVSTMKVSTGRRENILLSQLIPTYRPRSAKASSAGMVKGILFLGGFFGWVDQRMDGVLDNDQGRRNSYKILQGCKCKHKRKIKIRKRLSLENHLLFSQHIHQET